MPTEAFGGVDRARADVERRADASRRDGRKVVVDSRHVLVERRDGRQLVLESEP